MMIKRKLFERAGGFNESFIICGSDVELCIRIHEMGCRNIYTPFAVLYHRESASRDSGIPINDFKLSLKSYGKFLSGRDPYYNPNLTLTNTGCSLKSKDEEELLQEIRENAVEQRTEPCGGVIGMEKQPKTSETIAPSAGIGILVAAFFSMPSISACIRPE